MTKIPGPIIPGPRDVDAPIGALVRELAGQLGSREVVAVCVALLEGADRAEHRPVLEYLVGRRLEADDPRLDPARWRPYWGRVWGARGLLHVWEEQATPAVVSGLADEHWRPAEMCLRVATRQALGEAGPGALRLLGHALPRVRVQALRTLAAAGDTEHVAAVRAAVDDEDPEVRHAAARALEALGARLDLPPEPGRGR